MPRLALVLLCLAFAGCGGASGGGGTTATAPAGAQVANGPARASTNRDLGVATPEIEHGRASRAPVPILMYHVIAPAPPGAKYGGLWVPPAELKEQVDALAGAGYTAVTLDQVLDGWAGKPALPRHPVVLSFDDGYLSQGKDAGAILAAHRWPGVLNLAWHNLGVPGGITKSRIRTMVRSGWEIDAHSLTHPDLTTLGAAQLRTEVAGSRRAIQDAFGVPVDAFCYPAGKYDATVEAAVKAAGYRAATTELDGAAAPSQDPYALHRIRVNAGESAAAVLARVQAAAGR
ncbi:polysaccharide deacetylase family protein [Conexibacter woesei]|uniref:polysaccharide deacetylase family protein n=1 Tax=Conexibacter woesei TaxID=191495 RepID=UPI0004049270|nr:polysaccharide deacetylase family protein [Conexibacter woesei]